MWVHNEKNFAFLLSAETLEALNQGVTRLIPDDDFELSIDEPDTRSEWSICIQKKGQSLKTYHFVSDDHLRNAPLDLLKAWGERLADDHLRQIRERWDKM